MSGSKGCSAANADHILLHATGDTFDASTKTPRFVRRVVVHFDVTNRRLSEQPPERPYKKQGRKRPKKLRPAQNVLRHPPA